MDPRNVVYDRTRKLVFVTVEQLNQVVVFSSVDAHTVATLSVPAPYGIDITPEGSRVIVGTLTRFFALIDPNTLQVVQNVPVPSSFLPPRTPVTLANGKILFLTIDTSTTSPASELLEWNPTGGTFSDPTPPGFRGAEFSIARSADHSKALIFSQTNLVLYDSVVDSFGPTQGIQVWNGIAALSPDGSHIAVFNGAINELDNQFNKIASNTSINNGNVDPTKLIFSTTGSSLYVLARAQASIALRAQDLSQLGLLPVLADYGDYRVDTDETGMIFIPQPRGLAFADASAPQALGSDRPSYITFSPPQGNPSAPQQTKMNGGPVTPQTQVYFAAPPAAPAPATNLQFVFSGQILVTPPPAKQLGPVNVIVANPDGWVTVVPDAYSYGPAILYTTPAAGSPSGGTSLTIYGYGFDYDSSAIHVTIGGQSAAVTSLGLGQPLSGFPFPMHQITVTVPAGNPGLADITVTTPDGSATARRAFQYLQSLSTFATTGSLGQVIYDRGRQRLYATNSTSNQVDAFDLQNRQFLPSITVGNSPGGIALTPDGSKLVVANSGAGSISIINPDTGSVTRTVSIPNQGGASCQPVSVVTTSKNQAVIQLGCLPLLTVMDIASGTFGCGGSAGCAAMVSAISSAIPATVLNLIASGDGNEIFVNAGGFSGSTSPPLGLWNVTADTFTSQPVWGQHLAAADADGTLFANGPSVLGTDLNGRYYMQDVDYLGGGPDRIFLSDNSVPNEKLHPSGSLLYVAGRLLEAAQLSEVDVFDVHTGRLAMRVALPVSVVATLDAMAIDETGSRIFLISSGGLTVLQLRQVPLSIGTLTPSIAPAAGGTTITIRGSGFQDGAIVKFGATQVSATFVDESTIRVVTPSVPAGALRVTVTNPDGNQYSLDAAFTAT